MMEFDIKDQTYRTAKLDVFSQLSVSRKLLPVMASLIAEFGNIRALLPAQGEQPGPVFEQILPRIADKLAAMSEEDTNAIIFPCLAVVARKSMNSWVPVASSGVLVFDDIDLFTMLQLVARVVADSLGNFLPELLTSETEGQPLA